MQLSELANELVLQIFQSCTSVQDILALASTSRHFHSLLPPARILPILYQAAEHEYGPLADAVQVITYNPSQPAQLKRALPETLHNLKSLVRIGKTAKKWEEIYPEKKWKDDYTERRSLDAEECFRLRKAVYRLWLYSEAFHNENHVRTARRLHSNVAQRAALLRNWTTIEIGDIEDLRLTIRATLEDEVCPSNATIRTRFPRQSTPSKSLRHPVVNNHTHYHQYFASNSHGNFASKADEASEEGWGDEITHYYVIEDVMKLNPQQVYWLLQSAPQKRAVEAFLNRLGDWFVNNGETFGETAHKVCSERESESLLAVRAEHLKGLVLAGWLGIVQVEAEDGQG